MTESFDIRRATPADNEAILELLRLSLGEGTIPRTRAYWQWKHEINPFGVSPVLVAEADGQLVGVRAFMRWAWQSGARAVSAVRAVDTATHPDYRGRGLFKRLTLQLRDEMEEEGVGFVFNTPNAQSRPGYLKMGWALVGKPTLWVRPVQPLRLARALQQEGLRGGEGSPPVVEAASAADVLARPDIQAFIASASTSTPGQGYHTRMGFDFLQWRYAAVPGFAYQALTRGEGASGALAIVRSRQRGALRELRICDLIVGSSPAARPHARALLQALPHVADVDVVLGMRPSGLGAGTMVSTGYLPAPRTGPILTSYPLDLVGAPDPTRLENWHPSVGALELF